MIDGMLLPQPDEDSAPFFEWAAAGELRIQRCAACGRRRMPPQPMCPNCRSFEVEWERISGRARVWSVVVVHPPLLPAYEAQSPYNVVVVELVDDPAIRLVGNIVTASDAPLDSVDPHSIEIGDEVEVVFTPVASDDGDIVLPRWRPIG
jgi:uncharacterized OB-fold protein